VVNAQVTKQQLDAYRKMDVWATLLSSSPLIYLCTRAQVLWFDRKISGDEFKYVLGVVEKARPTEAEQPRMVRFFTSPSVGVPLTAPQTVGPRTDRQGRTGGDPELKSAVLLKLTQWKRFAEDEEGPVRHRGGAPLRGRNGIDRGASA